MNGPKNTNNRDITILVVDDDADVLRGTVLALTKSGFTILSASGGEEALGMLAAKRPEIALLDWEMPGMDGLEVCRRIKADPLLAATVVIMTSGTFTNGAQQLEGLSTGADGFIARPVTNVDLLARISAFATTARLTRALHEKNAENEAAIAGLRRRQLAELNLLEDAVRQRNTAELLLKELRDSESLYRTLVSTMGEGLTLQDENAAIIEFNTTAEKILGLTGDQLRGKTSYDPRWRAVREDGSPFPGEMHPAPVALRTGLPQSDVVMGIHKPDGTLTWILVNAQPLFRSGETRPYRVVATMHDVTERRQAEDRVRTSERRFRETLDQLMEGCMIIGFDWTCLYANKALARHGRKEVADLIGRNWLEVYPGIEKTELFAGYQSVMKERRPRRYEAPFVFGDGEVAWFELHVTPVSQGIFVMTHEITEAKSVAQRDAALLELEIAASSLGEKDLLQLGLDKLEELTRSKIGFLHFVNEAQDEISLITWTTDTMASYCQGSCDSHSPVASAGVWADSIREKRPVIVNDCVTAPNKKGLPEGYAHLQRFVSVPVLEKGLVRMIVGVGNAARDYGERDISAISQFSYEMYRIVQGKRAQALKNDSTERYRSITESSGDAIITADAAGNIVGWNPAARKIFGHGEVEAIGLPLEIIIPERHRAAHRAGLDRLRKGEAARMRGQVIELQGLRKDGTEFPLEVTLTYGSTSLGMFYAANIRDITQRKLADASLKTAEAKFRSIVEQTMVGVYMLEGEKLLYANPRTAEIFGRAPEKLQAAPLLPLVVDEDRQSVVNVLGAIDKGLQEVGRVEYRIKREDGAEVVVGTELRRAEIDGKPVKIGVLQDVTQRVRSERQMRDYTAQLERAMFGTVDAVSQMMDMRDPYTAGHERRVGELAAMIAAEMGLPEDVQRGLRVAGSVHDVGKITVPAEILGKPGKISAVEFEIIKTHAQQGYEVLKGVDFPWPVAEVARQHHERLDGSGYPRGLKGDEIILEARILAVADVVEAMGTHRPYRPALGIEKALGEIERGAGTAFDPLVVDACLKLFREKGYRLPDH